MNFEDWHSGQKLNLLSQSLHKQRCRQGNKSMQGSLTLQTLQAASFKFLFCFNMCCKLTSPLQQEAVWSTSLSSQPSSLSLFWALSCSRLYFSELIKFSLYFARCCQAPTSTDNCFICSSRSMFFLFMFSSSESFSLIFLRILSSSNARAWNCFAWTFANIDCLRCSP